MSRQYFQDAPYGDPLIVSPSAIVATTETALWPVLQYTPIPAYDPRAGKMYQLIAGGILSTAATGTLTITPRFGSVIGGVTLGASSAQNVPASVSNVAWMMTALLTIRTVGAPGTNSTAMLCGQFQSDATLTAGTAFSICFGGTSAAIDTSLTANGLWIGWTLSIAGSVTTQNVAWQSLN